MRSTGYTAGTTNRVLALLSHVFNLARIWNVAGTSVNPTAGIAAAPEAHRQLFLSPEETKRLMASISEDQNRARIRRRAGLADVRLHDLRHSFASFLVNQGVSLYVVQGL